MLTGRVSLPLPSTATSPLPPLLPLFLLLLFLEEVPLFLLLPNPSGLFSVLVLSSSLQPANEIVPLSSAYRFQFVVVSFNEMSVIVVDLLSSSSGNGFPAPTALGSGIFSSYSYLLCVPSRFLL